MYVCRHCEEEITHLDYSVKVQEYGTLHIEEGEHITDDTETNGDYQYLCPHCSYDSTVPERIFKEVNEADLELTPGRSFTMEEVNHNSSPANGNFIHNTTKIKRCVRCNLPCAETGCVCTQI